MHNLLAGRTGLRGGGGEWEGAPYPMGTVSVETRAGDAPSDARLLWRATDGDALEDRVADSGAPSRDRPSSYLVSKEKWFGVRG